MRKPPRLLLFGALAACALLAPSSALAQSGGSVQPKIVGGFSGSVSTYPWQAAVVYSTAESPGDDAHQRQFCGGSLLTSRIVITAGHCVADTDPDCSSLTCAINDPGGDGTPKIDPNDVDVVLGRSTLSDSSAGQPSTRSAGVVSGATTTANYHGDGVPRFDVAYLVLSSASGPDADQDRGNRRGRALGSGEHRRDQRLGEHQRDQRHGGHAALRRRSERDLRPELRERWHLRQRLRSGRRCSAPAASAARPTPASATVVGRWRRRCRAAGTG